MIARLDKVKLFRALGDETRLAMVRRLYEAGGSMACSALVEACSVSRPVSSYHYKELEGAGIIRRKREGQCVAIALNSELLERECPGLLESLR